MQKDGLMSMFDNGRPMAGLNQFAAPGYTPATNMQTTNFRAGQMTPANQMSVQQAYQQGGLVTPEGPAMGAPSSMPNVGLQDVQAEIQRIQQENPEVIQQIQQVVSQALQSGELTMQELNMAVQLATAAIQNPQMWPRLRQLAMQQGLADDQDLPMQYDAGIVVAIILAGEAMKAQGAPAAPGAPAAAGQPPVASMAKGGALPSESRNTDGSIPIVAHEGEYVIPADVVKRKGTEFFDKLVEKGKDTA